MNHKNRIPMMKQNIGGYQPQPQFDVTQARPKKCSCGCEYFNQAFRLGVISGMAPGNNTGKDVLVRFEAFLCRDCGKDQGQDAGPMPPGDE